MAMVCPRCKTAYEQQVECPVCHVRLAFQETRQPARGGLAAPHLEHWQHTPWGRLVGGILLAQGLYLGLVQGCLALQQARGYTLLEEGDTSLASLLLRQGLQCVSLLLGGMLAGVGQRRGIVFGALVGLWNSVFFLALQFFSQRTELNVVFYAQPILQTAFGAVGGLVSSMIWKPAPVLSLPGAGPAALPMINTPPTHYRAVPIAWGRIIAGIALAVGGTLWANLILDLVLRHTPLETTKQQDWLVTWEISVLAILAGSALAGGNTQGSVRQGVGVGIGTCVILIGILFGGMAGRWEPPPMLVLRAVGLRQLLDDPAIPIVFALGFTMLISLVGGWFGGQLFPPLIAAPRPHKNTREAVYRD
jgi:hypothetical protein